jgi:hypothetical protein
MLVGRKVRSELLMIFSQMFGQLTFDQITKYQFSTCAFFVENAQPSQTAHSRGQLKKWHKIKYA